MEILRFLLGIWSGILSCVCGRPNIVMIIADDMGFNDASFHGCQQIPTPNLDKLANSGIILNRYYALPSCTPTRSSIMTGKYPIHTGMQTGTIYAASPWALGLEEKILPQYLKELGYKTHAIGKWHLGFFAKEYTPAQRGFDTFYGYYGGQADYWDHSLASNGYWGLDLHKDTPQSSETIMTQWGNYSSNMYTMEAIDRIREHNKTTPLFLYLAYQAVHAGNLPGDALQAPQHWVNKFSHIKNRGRRHYAAMVAAMDDCVGKLYESLKANDLLDDTIIIFTSDNGGPVAGMDYNWATNFPLRGAKTTVYEGGTRVAGFIHGKMFTEPRVSYDLMHVSDWLPTILTAVGGDLSNLTSLDGFNQWETLKDHHKSPRTEVLVNIETGSFPKAALISGEWKLVNQTRHYDNWYPPAEVTERNRNILSDAEIKCAPPPVSANPCGGVGYKPCLFNIIQDPCEHDDLSDAFPDVYQSMLKRLQEYRDTMVKARQNESTDPQANPKKHGGVWLPWRKLEDDTNKITFESVKSSLMATWHHFFSYLR